MDNVQSLKRWLIGLIILNVLLIGILIGSQLVTPAYAQTKDGIGRYHYITDGNYLYQFDTVTGDFWYIYYREGDFYYLKGPQNFMEKKVYPQGEKVKYLRKGK